MIDCYNAFFSIPVHEARKYLSIHLRRETVHLTVMPQGLYESPSYLF